MTKAILITILVLAALVGFIHWMNARDDARDAAYSAYEQCVAAQYGTTPSAYYQEHGVDPECL